MVQWLTMLVCSVNKSLCLTQWGWPSGWTLGLKVAVLGLTINALVQVWAPALWKNSLGQQLTPLWAHQSRTMISLWLKALKKYCEKPTKKKSLHLAKKKKKKTMANNVSFKAFLLLLFSFSVVTSNLTCTNMIIYSKN